MRTALISDLYHEFKPSKNFWRGFDQWTFIRGQEADPSRSGPSPSQEEIDGHRKLAGAKHRVSEHLQVARRHVLEPLDQLSGSEVGLNLLLAPRRQFFDRTGDHHAMYDT